MCIRDSTEKVSVDGAIADVIARAGRIDIVVNNAGIGAVAAVEDFDDDEVLRVFDTNVFGPIRVVRAALPHMRKQRSGRIVNVGSLSAVVPSHFRGIYSATKAALSSISEALYYELHPWNIHVANIEPGFFATEIGDKRMETRRQATSDYAPLLERYERGSTPGGSERAEPTPVVDAIVQAATEESPKRHYLVGKDAEALGAMRKSMPDEDLAALVLRSMPSLEDAAAP
jgi:NAD(P)-dependent dehydrogenase (short-subunit alcohol dehydrogenase family)